VDLLFFFHAVGDTVLLHETAGDILAAALLAGVDQRVFGLLAGALRHDLGVAFVAEVDGDVFHLASFESLQGLVHDLSVGFFALWAGHDDDVALLDVLEVLDCLEFHETLGALHLGSGGWGRQKAKDRQCQAYAGDSKEVWFHSFHYRFLFMFQFDS